MVLRTNATKFLPVGELIPSPPALSLSNWISELLLWVDAGGTCSSRVMLLVDANSGQSLIAPFVRGHSPYDIDSLWIYLLWQWQHLKVATSSKYMRSGFIYCGWVAVFLTVDQCICLFFFFWTGGLEPLSSFGFECSSLWGSGRRYWPVSEVSVKWLKPIW